MRPKLNISIVRLLALKDSTYNPYCIRCKCLVRMQKIEHMFWKCFWCGASHDERVTESKHEPEIRAAE